MTKREQAALDAGVEVVRQQDAPLALVGKTEAAVLAASDDTQHLDERLAEEAMQEALKRHRSHHRRYDVKVRRQEEGSVKLEPSIGGIATDLLRQLNAFGTPSPEFSRRMLDQLVAATSGSTGVSEIRLNAALAAVDGIAPENEMEAMLAVQMSATHDAAMEILNTAKRAEYPAVMQEAGNLAIKLLRTYTAQIEALSKLRRGGEQKVRVEHVHVYEGGKAVVGDVNVHGRSDEFGEEPQGRERPAQGKPRLAALGNRRG